MGSRSGPTTLECRYCHRQVTLKKLREHHGKLKPECIYYRAWSWMYDRDYRMGGRDSRVLELAGVAKYIPVGRPFYWQHNETVDQDTGEVRSSYTPVDVADFVPVAPQWAITLARRLMDDQELVSRFGRFKLEDRKLTLLEQKKMKDLGVAEKGKKMVIPIELRAKIIRVAAQSAMTREFAADDLDVVLAIIRDTL